MKKLDYNVWNNIYLQRKVPPLLRLASRALLKKALKEQEEKCDYEANKKYGIGNGNWSRTLQGIFHDHDPITIERYENVKLMKNSRCTDFFCTIIFTYLTTTKEQLQHFVRDTDIFSNILPLSCYEDLLKAYPFRSIMCDNCSEDFSFDEMFLIINRDNVNMAFVPLSDFFVQFLPGFKTQTNLYCFDCKKQIISELERQFYLQQQK